MLSSQRLCPRSWSNCVGFILPPHVCALEVNSPEPCRQLGNRPSVAIHDPTERRIRNTTGRLNSIRPKLRVTPIHASVILSAPNRFVSPEILQSYTKAMHPR